MLITTLAFILAIIILAQMLLFLFFPKILQRLIKPFINAIKANYLNAQIIALSVLIAVGAVIISLIGFLPMIVAGWFWAMFYEIAAIPTYRHISEIASVKKLLIQKEFKTDMQLVSGVYIAISLTTVLYIISLWVL
ncbi:MAG: hypothetical protein VX112_06010 [Pseudomonadota bacterium]|nr:hypothetical protein [Pseudomonadota bacterium]